MSLHPRKRPTREYFHSSSTASTPKPLTLAHSLTIHIDDITFVAMKTHSSSKLKTPPRQLFSCGIFSYCTPQTALSPTHAAPPPPLTPTPPPPPPPQSSSSSSSSSTSTSQSFTQWRFPLPKSPLLHPSPPPPPPPPTPPLPATTNLAELFHVAELHFSADNESHSRLSALHLLERSLVPNPPAADKSNEMKCPAAVMREVVKYLKDVAGARAATKVLLALCLAEGNREVAVEAGAVGEVVEALAELEGAAAERALAALELLCMVAEGAAELRAHALAVPMLVEVMGKGVGGRGRECAISALSVVFAGGGRVEASAEAVARAVVLAMQGAECTARGRRKGAQLLRLLQESGAEDGGGGGGDGS